MKNKRYIALLSALLLVLPLVAEDKIQPVMQIEDNTFFDPSAKYKPAEKYTFGMEYRIEVGYVQHWQRTQNISFADMYLHGLRAGATFTFLLPKHFSLQTGLYYTLLYGTNQQHWRSQDKESTQIEYINHRVLAHNFTVPVRAYYTIPVWKQLNLFFYTGPQLHIGLSQYDYMQLNLSEGTKNWLQTQSIPVEPYERLDNELIRANIQWGLGGGIEWDRYRLQSGYDFGLNNLVKNPKTSGQNMSEWGWYVSFSYRFGR